MRHFLFIALLVWTFPAQAAWWTCMKGNPDPAVSGWPLRSHEPNRLGYTFDDSGQYMDFTVSVKFSIFEYCFQQWADPRFSVDFAFSGRLGQYFERTSSPVIGRRFNPELIFARFRHEHWGDFETSYAHESNGQRITDLASYQQTQATLEKPEHADDYISRGWDFVRFSWASRDFRPFTPAQPVRLGFTGKWFQKHGALQGAPEEYSVWENDPEGKPRKQVDGLTTGIRYYWYTDWPGITRFSANVTHTTGYKEAFRYNTVRVEGGVKIIDVPVVLWWAHGYNQDLVRYYNKTKYFGIAVVIENF
jgi:hypothetical protein